MNEFLTTEFTQVLQKLIKEVVNDPATYRGHKYLPAVSLPVSEIYTEVIEATGGLTNQHQPGTQPKYIQSFGSRVQKYEPPFYKEAINYNEQKILFFRKLGENGRNVRGVQQRIEIDMDRLNRRIEARMEYERWQAIFNGGITWMGKTISFNIPSANNAVPLGANWSLDGANANNAANPVADLRYWVTGGYAKFRKYMISGIVMNGNTARWILENANTKAYLSSLGANPNIGNWDVNKVLSFLIPGVPPVDIYNGWYQSETTVNGKLTVGDAQYFIPDGRIYFEVSGLPGGDKIGEFVQTLNLATGSIAEPGHGKFLLVEDNTVPGSQGGPKNPFLDLVGGVYGGPKLDRAFDVLTATVYTA